MNDSFENMDRYFSGDLTPAEKEAFEKRCVSDPAFTEELAEYTTIKDYLRKEWYENRKMKIAALEKEDLLQGEVPPGINGNEVLPLDENVHPGNVRRMKIVTRLAVAASLLGVIILAVTWYVQNNNKAKLVTSNNGRDVQKNETKKTDTSGNNAARFGKQDTNITGESKPFDQAEGKILFADYFEPDKVPEEEEALLQQAFGYYEKQKYAEAIRAFESVDLGPVTRGQTEGNLAFYASYYKGLSYLNNDNTKKAIAALKKLGRLISTSWVRSSGIWHWLI